MSPANKTVSSGVLWLRGRREGFSHRPSIECCDLLVFSLVAFSSCPTLSSQTAYSGSTCWSSSYEELAAYSTYVTHHIPSTSSHDEYPEFPTTQSALFNVQNNPDAVVSDWFRVTFGEVLSTSGELKLGRASAVGFAHLSRDSRQGRSQSCPGDPQDRNRHKCWRH